MKLKHVAIWHKDLERMKYCYNPFFDTKRNGKYTATSVVFTSFLHTVAEGVSVELKAIDSVKGYLAEASTQFIGLAHLAFAVSCEHRIDVLTKKMGC